MDEKNLKSAIEAVLFASGSPVETDRLAVALNIPLETAGRLCSELSQEYKDRGSGIVIAKLGDSYKMCSDKEHAEAVRTVMDIKTPLSQAASEVLAVIAYNQPVTKAFVEQVRGVDCSGVVANLIARGLIEEKGRLELPGRPLVYGTTEHFLLCFGISSLDELPPVPQDEEPAVEDTHDEDTGDETVQTEQPQPDVQVEKS